MNLPDLNFSTSQHCPPKVRGLARSLAIPLTLFLILLTGPTPATGAGPAGSDTQTVDAHARELIVLLAPDAFERSPAQLVEAVEQRSALPGSLATASPSSARLAVRTGHNLDSDDPTSPRARLARYVVLSFPATVDLDAARSQLLADPEIEFVEPNLSVPLSVLSNDPLLPITSNPAQHQWGIHQMNLPAAWDRMRGHAYLGLIDVGLDPTHPDLRPFPSYSTKGGCSYDPGPFQGGNFRPHLSWDVFENDCDVTEDHPTNVGHGTHVAGISAATTDNATGVAGHCWHCPVMMAKASSSSTLLLTYASVADSITFLVDRGAQSISMSFGFQGSCQSGALAILCTALQLAADHDVVLTASSGNGKRDINFPASDGRVLAIGGLQPGGVFWDEETIGTGECPCERDPRASPLCSTLLTAECGSNYSLTPGSSEQTLVVPARSVVSTFVPGGEWNPVIGCTDADLFPNGDGYGPCTGTSMASPAASALAGLVRSVNPLLDRGEVATALTSTASMAGSGDPKMGNGIPDAAAAVAAAFGEAGGQPIENRLTPLLSVWSTAAQTHLFTTVPQQIQAAFFDQELTDFAARGQALPFYLSYPEIPACQFGPCPVRIPTASVAILTSHVDPGTGLGAPVPLHRMSFDGPYTTGNPRNRSFAYTISDAEIGAFAQEGYRLDGLEGYLLPRCSPEPWGRPARPTPRPSRENKKKQRKQKSGA
ncbi:MAG: S8 family serine peptidase, partial [Acidobacteriota bacterium]